MITSVLSKDDDERGLVFVLEAEDDEREGRLGRVDCFNGRLIVKCEADVGEAGGSCTRASFQAICVRGYVAE